MSERFTDGEALIVDELEQALATLDDLRRHVDRCPRPNDPVLRSDRALLLRQAGVVIRRAERVATSRNRPLNLTAGRHGGR